MQVRHVFGSEGLYLVSESDGQSARKMSGDVSVDDVDAEDDSEGSDVPMTQSLINLLAAHNKKKAKKRKKKPTPQKKRQHALSDDDEDESPTARKTSRRQRLFSADDGAGESKEEEEARKKLRPEPRELWSVPQIGLGECDVSTRIKGVCGAHHRVWFRRADLTHKTNNPRCAPDGPFNDHRCLTWWKNPYAQLEFAERFAIPAQDHMALRPLSTDTRELQIDKDWCSAAIFAFCNTHRPTYLDIPRTPQVQGFCLPQHHGDRKSRMMLDGGANGGLAGVADCLLWKMSVCADTLTVDNEIMQVLTLLCRALRGGLAEVIPGVTTNYTETHVSHADRGCRIMHGGRFQTEYSDMELARRGTTSMSDDIDPALLDKIADYRCSQNKLDADACVEGLDDDLFIPKQHAVNDNDMAGLPMPSDSEPEMVLTVGLFTVSLFSHLMPGVDRQNCRRVMRVDCIRIVAKMPGVDPLIFLSQATKMPELVQPLHNIVSHMNMVLRKATAISSSNMFSTGGNFQIAKICTEAHMALGIFLFADSERIFDISFGGMRINVSSDAEGEEDKRIYQLYLSHVERARSEHYQTVFLQVTQDLAKATCQHQAKPLLNFGLNFWQGQHYRSMPSAHLRQHAQKYVDSLENCVGHNEESLKVDEWLASVLMSEDRNTAYVAVGGGLAWNCGIFVAYNPDAFLPYCKPGPHNKTGMAPRSGFDILPQPVKCAPMVEMYFESKMGTDGFECLWRIDNDIILDLEFLKDNSNKLSAVLCHFLEEINEIASSTTISSLQGCDIREEAILLLYGASGEDRLHRTLANTQRNCDLADMARNLHSSVQQHISSALVAMATGELLQFSWAARTVLDLKKQKEENGLAWMTDMQSINSLIRARLGTTDCVDLLCSETQTALFISQTHQRMNLEVSFMNQSLKESINWGTFAQFCSMTAWGVTVQMTNCASTVQVIVTLPNQDRRAVTVNKKESSVGADTLCDMIGQENNAYGRCLVMCLLCSKFYNSEASLDKTCKWVSPLAMATFQGSGMAVGPDGMIKLADGKGLLEAGLNAFFTENRKLNTDSSASFLANLENFLGDSGAGPGTQKVAWSSTTNLVGVSFVQFYPFPCSMVCGNVQETREPRSMVDGGRTRILNSSVLDGPTGCIHLQYHTPDPEIMEDEEPTSMRFANECRSDKTDMKTLTAELTHDHMVAAWLWHCRRKAFPFIHRVMTLGVVRASYVLGIDMRSLGNTVRDITDGVRRGYFKNENTLNRTWDGPFKVVSLVPSSVTYTLERCIRGAIARATKVVSKFSVKIHVPLYEAFEDSVISMLKVPISFTCVLNALHLWQFASILDVSVMILSCFMLFTMGLKQNCPLHVLALAANGHTLTKEQEKRYDAFASWLVEAVTSPDSTAESAEDQRVKEQEVRAWQSFEAAQARGISMTRHAHLFDTDKKDLIEWHTWEQDGKRDLMRGKRLARVNSDRNGYTTYMQSPVQYVVTSCPEWMGTQEQERHGNMPKKFQGKYDAMSMDSSENIIATAFASLQTPACDEVRAAKRLGEAGQRRGRGVHMPSPIATPPHEYSDTFWQAAYHGTRLPQVDRKSSDTSDLVHPAAWLSPLFYQDAMATLGTGSGPIKQFLTLCEMHPQCNRTDLLKKLLHPYLKRHKIRRKFQRNKFWSEPILDGHASTQHGATSGKTAYQCFKWGALPFEENNGIEGVQISLNVDIVWMIVSQGLFANEWSGSSDTESHTVVHLRNLASANLVLLSLLIHTCIEKAAIPSNSGLIMLNHQHPNLALTAPASIYYNEKLHVDSYPYLVDTLDVDTMICTRMRKPEHFRLLVLSDGQKCLYYRNIINAGEPGCVPKTVGDLFPYPPEAVYHMQTHFMMQQVAYKRVFTMPGYTRREHTLQAAVQIYGSGVEENMVTHIPATLTHCVVRGQREIPCFTYKHGMLFTMQVINNQVHIIPTLPTHVFHSHALELETIALPVSGPHSFGVERLAEFMSSGLQLCPQDDGTTLVTLSQPDDRLTQIDPLDRESPLRWLPENALPFALHPVVHWKHAVEIFYTHETVSCRDPVPPCFGGRGEFLRVVPVQDWLAYHQKYFILEPNALSVWLVANPDVPAMQDPDCTLYMSSLDWGDDTEIRQDATGQTVHMQVDTPHFLTFFAEKYNKESKKVEILYFQNKAHLKWVLTSTDGMPFAESYTRDWVERDVLIAGRQIHMQDAQDEERGAFLKMFSLSRGASGLELRVCEYDDSKMDKAAEDLAKSKQCLHDATTRPRHAAAESSNFFMAYNAEYFTNLIATTTQKVAQGQELLSTLQAAGVQCVVIFTLDMGDELDRTWQLGPKDYWSEGLNGMSPAIGVVKPHPGTTQFLCDGLYHVECQSNERGPASSDIDFMTMSRCFLREGQAVFIRLTPALYTEIRNINPRVSLPHPDQHAELLEGEIEFLDLVGYYVLGSASAEDSTYPCVKICLLIHTINVADMRYYYNEESKHKMIVTLELHSDNAQNVYVERLSEDEPIEHLCFVDQEPGARRVARDQRGIGKSRVW